MHSKLCSNLILECENLFGMSVIQFINKNKKLQPEFHYKTIFIFTGEIKQ